MDYFTILTQLADAYLPEHYARAEGLARPLVHLPQPASFFRRKPSDKLIVRRRRTGKKR